MIIMHDGGGIGGDTGARAGVGDHSGSGGGDAAGSVHCEAGSDSRVRFLAPGIVGWDLGEKKFLGRLSLRLCQVLGENSTHSSSLWLPGTSAAKNCGPTQETKGLSLTPSSLHSFIEDNEIGSISKNALRGLRSLTHLCVPPPLHCLSPP